MSLVGIFIQHQMDAARLVPVHYVPFVQLDDNLLHGHRHGLESPSSAAVNGVAAIKRDHIAIPVGAFRAGRGLCALDRCDLVGTLHF